MSPSSSSSRPPIANLLRDRRLSGAWILPIVAIIIAGWIGWRTWSLRGEMISVQLNDGHGIKSGDAVRYLGIVVGEVRQVRLNDERSAVLLTVNLQRQADDLARAGSRFWVVRPQLAITEVTGLETLLGPHYLTVLPGDGKPQRHFIGLDAPPVVESIAPGDLEIILETSSKGSLRPGSPVMYRQVRIGTVLSVGLASDGHAVEARVHINRAFASLIHANTKFWDIGGLSADFGLTGFSINVESMQTLFGGGIALATPPPEEAAESVRTGHRFVLADEIDNQWLTWQPLITIGSDLLPPGAPMPVPLRAKLVWTHQRLLVMKTQRMRTGWLLQTDRGLLGPADLIQPVENTDTQSAMLEVNGQVMPLAASQSWNNSELASLDVQINGALIWQTLRIRKTNIPEDCIAIADANASTLPLATGRLTPEGMTWRIDPAVTVDESWHGAAVLARSDGMLVGVILVINDDEAIVALIPDELITENWEPTTDD